MSGKQLLAKSAELGSNYAIGWRNNQLLSVTTRAMQLDNALKPALPREKIRLLGVGNIGFLRCSTKGLIADSWHGSAWRRDEEDQVLKGLYVAFAYRYIDQRPAISGDANGTTLSRIRLRHRIMVNRRLSRQNIPYVIDREFLPITWVRR